MSITRVPAIYSGGAWNALYPAVQFTRAPIYESTYRKVEFADIASGAAGLVETHGQSYGQEIQVSGKFNLGDLDAAKLYEEEFEGLLIGEDGKGKTVDLCEWVDSATTRLGVWRSCVLAGPIRWGVEKTLKRLTYDFTLRSPYPRRFATGTDGSLPDTTGTWAAFYGSSASGIIATPAGGTIYVAKVTVPITVSFPGIVDEATGANAENVARLQRRVVLNTQGSVVIKSIRIQNATPAEAGGGTTTARVADAAYGGSITHSMSCSIGAAETWCAPVTTGSFTVAAGVPVYVNFTAAGYHSAVEVVLEVMAL